MLNNKFGGNNNGGGNPNHDENGRFTSKGNASSGKSFEEKVMKKMGLSERDLEVSNNSNQSDNEIVDYLRNNMFSESINVDFMSALNNGDDKEAYYRWRILMMNLNSFGKQIMKDKGWNWDTTVRFVNGFLDRMEPKINQSIDKMVALDKKKYEQNKNRYDKIIDKVFKDELRYGVSVRGGKEPFALDENWYDDIWYRLPNDLKDNSAVLEIISQKLKSGEYKYDPRNIQN